MKEATVSKTENSKQAELALMHARLKDYFKDLEREYKRLAVELDAKRKARAERAHQDPASENRARLDRISGRLQKYGVYVDRQKRYLAKVQKFHNRNVRLLQNISQRLQDMDQRIEQADAGAVPGLAGELQQMLSELAEMRRRREELMQQVQSN